MENSMKCKLEACGAPSGVTTLQVAAVGQHACVCAPDAAFQELGITYKYVQCSAQDPPMTINTLGLWAACSKLLHAPTTQPQTQFAATA